MGDRRLGGGFGGRVRGAFGRVVGFCVLCAVGGPFGAVAQEAGEAVPADVLTAAVDEYDLAVGLDRPVKVERLPAPVLAWTNPLRDTPGGAVFLWTEEGRPCAIASVYTYGESSIDHEFQSLAAGPLVGRRDGKVVWRPQSAGIEFRPAPDAPAPAADAARRLGQMRAIARRFSAGVGEGADRHELRLLAQPLHRYGEGDAEGAVFALVQATDPEVLLLIESRGPAGGRRWEYGLARMTDRVLEVREGDRAVWTADAWDWRRREAAQPYIKFTETVGR